MEMNSLKNVSEEEEERTRILRLRDSKQITLSRFSPEIRKAVNKIFDELVCEVVFQFHMELKISLDDSKWFSRRNPTPDESLLNMADQLNIIDVNQNVECPKCFILVKCQCLSKHLAACMNLQQNTFLYSSRASSRIARQRIQETFKSSNNESRIDIDDVPIKSKRRNNKSRKS